MKVKKAMHKGVIWVAPSATISEVAKKMHDNDIGAIPVGENDRLIGMVTDRDIVCRGCANGKDFSKLTARDVMTPGITYCKEENELEDAIHIMESKKIRRLPVLDQNKRMTGMLSLGDLSKTATNDLTAGVMKAVSAHHR